MDKERKKQNPNSEKLKFPNLVTVNKRETPPMRIYWNFWCPLGTDTEWDLWPVRPRQTGSDAVHEKVRAPMNPNGWETCRNSQHFKPPQPQIALKEKNTKGVKNFFSCFFLFPFFQRVLEK